MILYYSATGNSMQLALLAAERLGTAAVDIMSLPEGDIDVGGDTLGIVCPVWFYNVPPPVVDALSRIKLREDQQVWAAITCGTTPAACAIRMRRLLEDTGGSPRFVMTYRMPENYIPLFKAPSEEECQIMLSEVDGYVDEIREELMLQDVLLPRSGPFARLLTVCGRPVYDIIRNTRKFRTDGRCTSCGLCEEICPVHAIEVKDDGPVWTKDKCWHCMACINRCPSEAIQYGKRTEGRRRYENPVLRR